MVRGGRPNGKEGAFIKTLEHMCQAALRVCLIVWSGRDGGSHRDTEGVEARDKGRLLIGRWSGFRRSV